MADKEKMKDNVGSTLELEKYLKNKARKHKYYKIYTTIDRINTMLDTNSVYLNNGAGWNDLKDRERLNCQKLDVIKYAKCFSFSKSENVAMWMLYGGNEGKGAMIDFSQTVISGLLKKGSIALGKFNNHVFKEGIMLSPDEYEIELIDVLYVGEDKKDDCYTIKRSDERVSSVKKIIVDGLSTQKEYAWSYENECRLIVSVKREYILSNDYDTVRIILNDNKSGLRKRVYYSPNYRFSNREYNNSTLHTKMDWDLCKGCDLKKRIEGIEGGASCQSSL